MYNTKTGFRDGEGTPMKLPAPVVKSMLVIEGIHAINPAFLKTVPSKRLFKVYISSISSLQLDEANALKTTDNRLLRRMSRDYLFRGHSASKTLSTLCGRTCACPSKYLPSSRRGRHGRELVP